METEELKQIVTDYMHWLNQDCEGWESMRANLHNVDLRGKDLHGVNLICADLSGAKLAFANLSGANLRNADLRDADLRRATLCYADLSGVYMCDADLRCCVLSNAKLCGSRISGSNLSCADLSGADLSGTIMNRVKLCHAGLCNANLRYAHLINADLHRADLREVNLRNADLSDAKNVPFIPMVCPDKGAFTGWKKADSCIIELRIPVKAKRSSGTGRKCRCSEAFVVAIEDADGVRHDDQKEGFKVRSDYDSNFVYQVGKKVRVSDFDPNRFRECTEGIHFFMDRQEATNYTNRQDAVIWYKGE